MLRYKQENKAAGGELCQCRIIHGEKVQRAKESRLPGGEVERLADFFKAFADPTRLKILRALSEEEMCVCDLAAFLGISESAVSHQLRMLRQLALVANRREGVVLYYHLTDAHVSQLVQIALEHLRE
ncbi:ArsR/SmtB family transcription factor [Thiovibrio frasassiensis]|uniref:Metalloregulator ArsR/SmtB family transcription factor n=1 Tax=Thiovibrio frasassiensis TaxID=2984131 RepID=A0A9X4RNA9_9BACT|nr:metalloregulator ArsR/SmtB family transcription factor [Thiovibrio frasassiensis]MDG4477083.1 metalloregulator ArsR/SmtB family transcription factor [Thiovibrio frasassiensis]